jgi:hypothetical protein
VSGDTIVLLSRRQINDADSIVVIFNLLFPMSTALVGASTPTIDKYRRRMCGGREERRVKREEWRGRAKSGKLRFI